MTFDVRRETEIKGRTRFSMTILVREHFRSIPKNGVGEFRISFSCMISASGDALVTIHFSSDVTLRQANSEGLVGLRAQALGALRRKGKLSVLPPSSYFSKVG